MSHTLEFLKQFESKHTIRAYRFGITVFLRGVYGEGSLEVLSEKYFSEKRNHEKDLQDFFVTIKERPSKTINLLLSVVRTFLIENKVEFSQLFWRKLRGRIKGSRALTIDEVLSNKELKRIIEHLPLNAKALFLTLASSGMRIGEALQLKLDDLDFKNEPTKITVQGKCSKCGNSRITFVS